jgi:hypothetical protein
VDEILGINEQTPIATEREFGLEEIAAKTGKTINVTRRNLEGYREYAKLEREWLSEAEVEHLKRAIAFCEARKRPLQFGLEQCCDPDRAEANTSSWSALKRPSGGEVKLQPPSLLEPAKSKPVKPEQTKSEPAKPASEKSMPAKSEPEKSLSTKSERANLSEMARELAQLRVVHRELRSEHERQRETFETTLRHLRVEGDYFPAWEARLRNTEEEVAALWDAMDKTQHITQSAAPRLEKIERRVGYNQRRVENTETVTAGEPKKSGSRPRKKSKDKGDAQAKTPEPEKS